MQRLTDAAVADEPAGQGASVLAALEDLRAGDEGSLVAVDLLHEAAAFGRHVVHQFGLLHLQAVVIDQIDVGAQARRKPAAVGEAEEIGGFAGLALDQHFHRQLWAAAPVAAPMGQHEGRHAGIDDRGAMGAAVAQAEQAGRIVEHFQDRRVVAGDVVDHREVKVLRLAENIIVGDLLALLPSRLAIAATLFSGPGS